MCCLEQGLNGYCISCPLNSPNQRKCVRRLLLFPQGNQGQGSVSLFLENVEAAEATAENDKWAVCAQFVVAMVNPTDDRVYKISSKEIMHSRKRTASIYSALR